MFGIARGTNKFQNADLRDGKTFPAAFNDQGGNNRQGQRNFDDEGRTTAFNRFQFHRTADLFDVGPDHVHPHTTTGNRCHLFCCREARLENELVDLLIRHVFQFAFGHNAVGQRLFLDPRDIKATAIIGNLDNDVPAFMIGVQGYRTGFALARITTALNIFQAVVGRVPNHVGQRVLDQFKNLTVQFGISTNHLQIDLFAHFKGKVAHDTRQFCPGITNRLHTGFHHPFLQVGGDMRQTLQRNGKFAVILATNHLQQLVPCQHQFGNQCHQVFKQFDIHTNGLGRNRAFLGFVARMGFALCPAIMPGRCRSGNSLGFRCRRRCRGGCRGSRFRLGFGFWLRCGGCGRLRLGFRGTGLCFWCTACTGRQVPGIGKMIKTRNQIGVISVRLGLVGFKLAEQIFDGVDRFKHQRHGIGGNNQFPVTNFAQNVFTSMGNCLKARQPQKAACPFDGMNQTEDIRQNIRIVRVLFKLHQLYVERRKTFRSFGKKFT